MEEMDQNLRGLQLRSCQYKIRKKEDLSKELQKEQSRVSELETLNSSFENMLGKKSKKKYRCRKNLKLQWRCCKKELEELKTRKWQPWVMTKETWKVKEPEPE